jgi:hypothetical protein
MYCPEVGKRPLTNTLEEEEEEIIPSFGSILVLRVLQLEFHYWFSFREYAVQNVEGFLFRQTLRFPSSRLVSPRFLIEARNVSLFHSVHADFGRH